ncbi:MAG: NAD(+) synthase [Desulfovibrio sp.]|nr:NAD(+) synthase [Desulfovibrio sp.]
MKIALLQINPSTGAVAENAGALLAAARQAGLLGAELCLAPELALCGQNAGDLLLRPGFMAGCREALRGMAETLAREERLPPLLLGAPVANPVPQGRPLQNCAVFLRNGKVTVLSRKVLFPYSGDNAEQRYFEPGVSCGVLSYKGWRLAVTVGEDIWNDRTFWQERQVYDRDPVSEFMGAAGADGLINLTALPYARSLPAMHQRMLGWTAVRYRTPVLAVNAVGGNDDLVYFGGSFAFDGEGRLLARAPAFTQSLLLVDMSGRGERLIAPNLTPEEEIWQAVVLGTRDFVRKRGFSDVVLVLSGDAGSALTAAIACEALGSGHVRGLALPGPDSRENGAARALAAALGLTVHILPVGGILEALRAVLDPAFPGDPAGRGNLQAQARSLLLGACAHRLGALALSTENKSERAAGRPAFLAGAAGDLAPLGDLYASQVHALCRWHNERHAGQIPPAVLKNLPPPGPSSAGKGSGGLPPEDLPDPLLVAALEKGGGEDALIAAGFDPDQARLAPALIRGGETGYRRTGRILQVAARDFGVDRRIPSAGDR